MNINLTLLMQAIGFGLFIWFCAKFVWPPLMRAVETRQRQIAEGLQAGEEGRKSLVTAEQRVAAMIADARGKAGEIVATGEKFKAETIDQAKVEAQAERERIIAAAKAEAAQAPAHASAASHSIVVDQVAVRVIKAIGDGIDRLSIALNPPELGRVEVRMEIGPQGHVNAVFTADRPQTADMLQRGAQDLSRSLQDAGLRADNGSLSFNLRGQNQQQQQQQHANMFGSPDGGRQFGSSKDDFAEAAPAPAAVYRRSANTSRLDISV